ncbi:MAG: polysaccharide deacetylase family protein [Oscillibacter sp.]|nr:polysaccharide deacetylase family protein [Oscillibacter sp.]
MPVSHEARKKRTRYGSGRFSESGRFSKGRLIFLFYCDPKFRRRAFAALGAAALCASLLSGCGCSARGSVTAADQAAIPALSENWGLSFPAEGQTPAGNTSAAELAKYDAYYVGDTSKKVIYLTFDCGYENGNTGAILDALEKHHAPAAFFVVGHMLTSAPELIRRMADDGFIVGNHTFHHPDMSAISDQAAFQKELDDTASLYRQVTGKEMSHYYRPPRGVYSVENLKQAQALGYKTIFWSLAYVDWYADRQPTPEQAYAKLLPRIHSGAIVLLHQTSSTNAQILDELLSKWEAMGYTFASLDQLPPLPA